MLTRDEALFLFAVMSWNPQSLIPLAYHCHVKGSQPSLASDEFHEQLREFLADAIAALDSHGHGADRSSSFDAKKAFWLPLLAAVVKPNDARRRSLQAVLCPGPSPPGGAALYISGKYPALQPLLLRMHRVGFMVQCFEGRGLEDGHAKMWPARPHTWAALPADGVGRSIDNVLRSAASAGLVLHVGAESGIVRATIPAVDDANYDMTQHFVAELWAVCRHVMVEEQRAVLFYCSAGMHRSATMLAAFLLHETAAAAARREKKERPDMDVAAIVALINQARSFAMPTDVCLAQLHCYLQRLRGDLSLSSNPVFMLGI